MKLCCMVATMLWAFGSVACIAEYGPVADDGVDMVVDGIDFQGAELTASGCPLVNQMPDITDNWWGNIRVNSSGNYAGTEAWYGYNSDNAFWLSELWESPAYLVNYWLDGPRYITKYSIKFTNGSLTSRAPRNWTLEGLYGTQWKVIDTRQNQTNWAGTETRTFNVASPGNYEIYMLRITHDNDSRSDIVTVSIAQLALFAPDCN